MHISIPVIPILTHYFSDVYLLLHLSIPYVVELSIFIVSANNAFVQSRVTNHWKALALPPTSNSLDIPQGEFGLPSIHVLLEVM